MMDIEVEEKDFFIYLMIGHTNLNTMNNLNNLLIDNILIIHDIRHVAKQWKYNNPGFVYR